MCVLKQKKMLPCAQAMAGGCVTAQADSCLAPAIRGALSVDSAGTAVRVGARAYSMLRGLPAHHHSSLLLEAFALALFLQGWLAGALLACHPFIPRTVQH